MLHDESAAEVGMAVLVSLDSAFHFSWVTPRVFIVETLISRRSIERCEIILLSYAQECCRGIKLRKIFPSERKHRVIFVSLLTTILAVSTFAISQGELFQRSGSKPSEKPLEYGGAIDEQSSPTNDLKTDNLKASLANALGVDTLQSSSTNGPEVDKLRFKVIEESIPPPTPDEVLQVDGYDGSYGDWTLIGATPYLDSQDYPTSYIETTDYCALAGFFSFENTTLDDIAWGRIEAYAQSGWSEIDGDIYLFSGGQSWVWAGSIEATSEWSWVESIEIPSVFLNPTSINELSMTFHYWTPDSSSGPVMRIDAVTLALGHEAEYIPSTRVEAMQNGDIDVLTGLVRPDDIDELSSDCFSITSTPGFHLTHIGFNLMRPYLDDVALKHALFHAYNQEEIIASIYGYTVTPVQSLVPPSQGEWFNPALPTHPFNPGNVGDMYPAQHSTFGIMAAAGYTYVGTGYGDLTAHWEKDGVPLPTWKLWTPTYAVAPTSAQHGANITDEWHRCGFNDIIHETMDFSTYISRVFDDHDFDMYFVGWGLDRFPTQLYFMCHSSEYVPGSSHAVGLNDPVLDSLVETAVYSLDHDAAVAAAWAAQERLYDPTASSQALAYMNLYSRVYFNAFNPGLRGIVNSPGYGSNNMWTLLNMRWEPGHPFERLEDGNSTVIWCIGEEPATLNYLATATTYEQTIVGPTMDRGIQVNPYTHGDVVWQYSASPTIAGPITETTPNGVYIEDGMSVTFYIRDDIYWQDGNKLEADDAIFSLEFLRDNEIPQYITTWQNIEDTYKVDTLTFKVWANNTSPFHVYNWDKGAFLCPPQVWGWLDGQGLATILDYDPSTNTTDTGPWSYPLTPNGPKTLLFGTGPFVFDSYNQSSMSADLHGWDVNGINPGYFKTAEEIHNVKADLFWACGDVNRDGVVDQIDEDLYEAAFGSTPGSGNWNPDCDLNLDGIVDYDDGAIIGFFMGKRREYPEEIIDVAVLDVTASPTAVHPGQKINITATAKNMGNAGFTANFTYYYDDTFIVNQTATNLIPCHNTTLQYLWDTAGVSPGVYTLSVNATVLDGVDANLTNNGFTNGIVKIGTTKIAVTPETSTVGSVGKGFSINITIADAPYNTTWAWEFKLSWNTTLLNITDIREGTFLNENGQWITAFVNITNYSEGWVLASCTLLDNPIQHGQPLPDDNATLATIDFTVLNLGNCTLHLSDTILLDLDIDPYYHTTQDGEFEVLLGDINRDGIVDSEDLEILELAYGSRPGDPNWNPEADIWGPEDKPDGFINVYDLAMLGKKYGETP